MDAGNHSVVLRKLMMRCFSAAETAENEQILRIYGKRLDLVSDAIAALREEMFEDTCHPLGDGTGDTSVYGLMEWWEDFYGITEPAATAAERRLVLVAKRREKGGSNRVYFELIAEALGYKIGTHAEVGDPHVRLVDGEFPQPCGDYAWADVARTYDNSQGASLYTSRVLGTSVESDEVLQAIFEARKVFGTEIIYVNE
jgi:hypothetical protein